MDTGDNNENRYSIPKIKKLYEAALIKAALKETDNNRTEAAKLLEISHRALLYKMTAYGLGKSRFNKTPPINIVPVRRSSKGTGKYITISASGHPYADGRKSLPEHVAMMELYIGRRIKYDECVHHIDMNKSNNDIRNLMLMTKVDHARLHAIEKRVAIEPAND